MKSIKRTDMSRNYLLFFVLLSLLSISCKKKNNDPGTGNNPDVEDTTSSIPNLVSIQGQTILDENGNPLLLQGVAFGNEVWTDNPYPSNHHDERDYQRVADMGMNAIRFYMNYKTFEDDANPYVYKDKGWEWIDKNIEWAKKHNVYLILNMHVPQGGFQSNGDGLELWNSKENQRRLANLWKAIAERYKGEKQIAGFDLLNEPVVSTSIDQWINLANEIVDSVRTVNEDHLIFVERLNAIKSDYGDQNSTKNLFLINDPKIVYEFHFYDPIEYTHQNASWTDFGDGGKYPDESKYQFPTSPEWVTATQSSPTLPAGTSDWQYYEGKLFKVTNTNYNWLVPTIQVSELATGTAYVDSIVVREYNEKQEFVRIVKTIDLEDASNWYFWSESGDGSSSVSNDAYSGNYSFEFTGSSADANFNNNGLGFIPVEGYSYSASGYMKGEDIPASAQVRIRIDVYTVEGGVIARNKAYLESVLNEFLKFGKENNVPMYCGEFGVISYTFQNEKGGINWVEDMLDIFEKHNTHFTYHSYHEDAFGIYYGYGGLVDPSNANQDLIDLFKRKLKD